MNEFFAVCRRSCNHYSAWIDDRGPATKPEIIVFTDAVRCNHVALIFDRACNGKYSKMFVARERPRGRDNKTADILLSRQISVHLGKAEVVADAEAKTQVAKRKARKLFTRGKTRLFLDGRDRV